MTGDPYCNGCGSPHPAGECQRPPSGNRTLNWADEVHDHCFEGESE